VISGSATLILNLSLIVLVTVSHSH